MSASADLPPFPQTLPKSQPAWQSVVNTFQQWRQLLQGQKWQAATLLNSWANQGGGYNPAGYYVDVSSRVWLRGLITSGASGTAAFVLPWTPPYTQVLSASADTSAVAASAARLIVDTSGNAIPYFYGGTLVNFSLDGLSFSLLP